MAAGNFHRQDDPITDRLPNLYTGSKLCRKISYKLLSSENSYLKKMILKKYLTDQQQSVLTILFGRCPVNARKSLFFRMIYR